MPANVRAEVADFHVQHSVGSTTADAFCAWWLHRRYQVEPQLCIARAPGGNFDRGLDGYHLERRFDGGPPVLHLLQAKFSDSHNHIRRAVKEFENAVAPLANLLERSELPPVSLNSLYFRLQTDLRTFEVESNFDRRDLRLHFEILHLSDAAGETLTQIVSSSREGLLNKLSADLQEFSCDVRAISPSEELADVDEAPVKGKKAAVHLRFRGQEISDSDGVRFFAGFGYLSDLVGMHDERGDAIFSKNVRSYLFKAHERGPAKYMRDSLKKACVPTKGRTTNAPERFAMLHNGVTIAATSAKPPQDGRIAIFEPAVLNGCQTVKNASLWIKNESIAKQVDMRAWDAVLVPVRILVTGDEDLVRDVTISNNRQNAIRASAFRANDPVQLRLADRFRSEAQVYYERQDAAFENLRRSSHRLIDDEYFNSLDRPMRMEELAVAIAVASRKPALSVAVKAVDLFEDKVYEQVFAEAKLTDLKRLIFLRNLLAVMPLVLKDVKQSNPALADISAPRFAYPCVRVLSSYIREYQPVLMQAHGGAVISKFPLHHPLRTKLKTLMHHSNSRLLTSIKSFWWESSTEKWRSATEKDAVEFALAEAGVADADFFA